MRTNQIQKISQKEYNRIKDLNKNGFFNRRAFEFRNKYYEYEPTMRLSDIYKWQKATREAAEEQAIKDKQQRDAQSNLFSTQ